MLQRVPKEKSEQSAKLAADVEAFLAAGREIHHVTFEETKMAREQAKKKRPRAKSGAFKFTAVTSGPDHQWRKGSIATIGLTN